jgi:predicted DNA repair protein MutK
MAGSQFFALFDDIAALLDDIAMMSKVAAKKTAGVLGDDLALNAQQVTGVKADREIPVVWAVAKGSFKNKLILVPAALIISAFIPWLITPMLMLGGAYLCYEGVEKITHSWFHKEKEVQRKENTMRALTDDTVDMVSFEKDKIKGAIRTDFILSAEIVVIALGTVQNESMLNQALVVSTLAILITVGVYGLVAGIVKLDDAGLYLMRKADQSLIGRVKSAVGRGLLAFAPWLMKALSVVGTVAMFLVGGGILVHGIPFLYLGIEGLAELASHLTMGGVLSVLVSNVLNGLGGVFAGFVVLVSVMGFEKIKEHC